MDNERIVKRKHYSFL